MRASVACVVHIRVRGWGGEKANRMRQRRARAHRPLDLEEWQSGGRLPRLGRLDHEVVDGVADLSEDDDWKENACQL